MTVIAIANLKGGVGKTSLTINLAAGLARKWAHSRRPRNVLAIDLDPQGNTQKVLLGPDAAPVANDQSFAAAFADPDFLELLNIARPASNRLVRPAADTPNLFVLPSRTKLLEEVRRRLIGTPEQLVLMRQALSSLDDYPLVLIDTAPALDDLLALTFSAADYVVIPVDMDADALEGAMKVTARLSELRHHGARVQILGYVANRVNRRRLGDVQMLEALEEQFKGLLFKTAIPDSVEIRYAKGVLQDVFRYNPAHPVAAALGGWVDEFAQRLENVQRLA